MNLRKLRLMLRSMKPEELKESLTKINEEIDDIIQQLEDDPEGADESRNLDELEQRANELMDCRELVEARAREFETGVGTGARVNRTLEGARVMERGGADKGEGEKEMKYRKAFMDFVLRGTAIPMELRENTLTTDAASAIPTVLVNDIIEKMNECGMVLPLITRTAYAAGVVIPTSSVKPVATWAAEGATSDKQKKKTGKITFSYFKLRCEISMSMEVGTMALSAFEAKFTENVSKAMTKALEQAIFTGNGTSQPKGITLETPVKTITFAGATPTYDELVSIEAEVPAEYEATAKWFMKKAQFMKFVAMKDADGQPIGRVNYGIAGKPERMLLGREVVIIPYDTGAFAGGIFDFSDYVLNTIYDMGIQKRQDWDTEDYQTKAVMSVDGKAVDAGSLVLFKAGA